MLLSRNTEIESPLLLSLAIIIEANSPRETISVIALIARKKTGSACAIKEFAAMSVPTALVKGALEIMKPANTPITANRMDVFCSTFLLNPMMLSSNHFLSSWFEISSKTAAISIGFPSGGRNRLFRI